MIANPSSTAIVSPDVATKYAPIDAPATSNPNPTMRTSLACSIFSGSTPVPPLNGVRFVFVSIPRLKSLTKQIDKNQIRKILYRQNQIKWIYCDKSVVFRLRKFKYVFPYSHSKNKLIITTSTGAQKFMVNKADSIVDYHYYPVTRCYPFYSYESGRRLSNINDKIYSKFGDMSDDEIFNYVYNILSSEEYQKKWGETCIKEIPKIPVPKPDATLYRQFEHTS